GVHHKWRKLRTQRDETDGIERGQRFLQAINTLFDLGEKGPQGDTVVTIQETIKPLMPCARRSVGSYYFPDAVGQKLHLSDGRGALHDHQARQWRSLERDVIRLVLERVPLPDVSNSVDQLPRELAGKL